MVLPIARFAVAAALLSTLAGAPAQAGPSPQSGGVVFGADSAGAVPGRYIVTRASGPSVVYMSAAEARRLALRPGVIAVEQDRPVRAGATPVWGLDRIDQREAKRSKSFTPTADGSAARAYVIDTGVNIMHKQIVGRAAYGYDFVDDDPVAADCNGHGTHVAGTIGGVTYGVAKKVRLVSVRVLDCRGVGYLSDIIAGVQWVTAHAIRPAVANMSLSAYGYSPALESAVARSIKRGITYVVAAGNAGRNAGYYSPAGLPAAITVAATDRQDQRAYFSNYGSSVDIFAPGVGVKSAFIGSRTATRVLSGTSMATPHVAGAVALILDAHPSYRPAQVRATLVRNATRQKVTARKGSPNRLLHIPRPPARAKIKTSTLPIGTAGKPYLARLALKSSRQGTWRVRGAALPTGLRLAANGRIVGTPAAATSRRVTITFVDYVPKRVSRTYTLTIR